MFDHLICFFGLKVVSLHCNCKSWKGNPHVFRLKINHLSGSQVSGHSKKVPPSKFLWTTYPANGVTHQVAWFVYDHQFTSPSSLLISSPMGWSWLHIFGFSQVATFHEAVSDSWGVWEDLGELSELDKIQKMERHGRLAIWVAGWWLQMSTFPWNFPSWQAYVLICIRPVCHIIRPFFFHVKYLATSVISYLISNINKDLHFEYYIFILDTRHYINVVYTMKVTIYIYKKYTYII